MPRVGNKYQAVCVCRTSMCVEGCRPETPTDLLEKIVLELSNKWFALQEKRLRAQEEEKDAWERFEEAAKELESRSRK